MKRILFIISILSVLSTACTTEVIDSSVVGTWKLTEYILSNEFDVNNDGIKSINLLDEIECENNEELIFESNGVVSSNLTFNPDVDVFLINEDTQDYAINVECDYEGVIGFALTYSLNGETVTYGNNNASLKGNKLYIVIENAIEIFNANATEVVATKDLTLVYTKQ